MTRDQELAEARELIARIAGFNDDQLAQVLDRWRQAANHLYQRVERAEAVERAAIETAQRAERRALRFQLHATRAEAEANFLGAQLRCYKSQSWPLVCEVCGLNDDVFLSRPPLPGDRCFEHAVTEGGAA